jgi:hypothetical protein
MADFILHHIGVEPVPLEFESEEFHEEEVTTLEREASTPIYAGSSTNRLAIIMILLKIQAKNPGMTNVCFDDVLNAINNHIIDKKLDSKMPKTRAEARKVITEIGLDYESIHACPCDDFLYFGEGNDDRDFCPKCNRSRYREGLVGLKIPKK